MIKKVSGFPYGYNTDKNVKCSFTSSTFDLNDISKLVLSPLTDSFISGRNSKKLQIFFPYEQMSYFGRIYGCKIDKRRDRFYTWCNFV